MSQPSTKPPIARQDPQHTTLHGHTLVDNYGWLRNKESEEVQNYLHAENSYAESVMAPTAELQALLYREMLTHIKETDVSVPTREGAYFYYARTTQGSQYPVYCRKPGTRATFEQAAEQVVLDVEALAKDQSFMSIGGMVISDDGNLVAYSADTTGFRQYTLHVKDLRTGELLTEQVERVGSLVWAADNRTLFYTVEDEEQKRQHQLFRHVLGTPHADDVLVLEEPDERFNLGAGRTRDGVLIIVESGSHTTSEGRFLRADDPTSGLQLIVPRRDNIEYYADHRNGLLYIRANDQGRNFRLVTASLDAPAEWTEQIAHREDVMLEDVSLFEHFAVASERHNGLEHLKVLHFSGTGTATAKQAEIRFPEPAYSVHLSGNREFATDFLRYSYQSLVTPASVFDYNVRTGESVLLKEQEVPGGFDRSLYASERILAKAADGTSIPVSIVYRKDMRVPHHGPLHVYGYGSYGYALPLGFNPNRLSLLDRGFVLAYAHIRGGGDLGKPWHDAGRLAHKRNTFTDFVTVTEHLLAEGYGERGRVAIQGGSAGGLLMGAVTNMRPDLFRAVVSQVPFVDVMNTMLDASLPLTVPEYEEWGNPNEQEAFETMLSYSPYDNLREAAYPAMLVKTSLHDSQVMYWEPAKYVAKMRTLHTGEHPVLLHTNMTAGHGGASGRYDYLKEIAFDYAFLLRELGVAPSVLE
ncbi:S9 family peptidase [Acidipila sp. EB88]|uniref:S9 family peptidase n=1 Tax=Acidipila sp. EB88 TaxID=2305226 RepID=UPI000F5F326F|nr:S9 family peptidase [Acidipila sp. EB88]RRA49790.1 S9 family peptidase [Acidipila sp. EB88]